jgi:hypothetical protein
VPFPTPSALDAGSSSNQVSPWVSLSKIPPLLPHALSAFLLHDIFLNLLFASWPWYSSWAFSF